MAGPLLRDVIAWRANLVWLFDFVKKISLGGKIAIHSLYQVDGVVHWKTFFQKINVANFEEKIFL